MVTLKELQPSRNCGLEFCLPRSRIEIGIANPGAPTSNIRSWIWLFLMKIQAKGLEIVLEIGRLLWQTAAVSRCH
jgi:hypothetical protein